MVRLTPGTSGTLELVGHMPLLEVIGKRSQGRVCNGPDDLPGLIE